MPAEGADGVAERVAVAELRVVPRHPARIIRLGLDVAEGEYGRDAGMHPGDGGRHALCVVRSEVGLRQLDRDAPEDAALDGVAARRSAGERARTRVCWKPVR